MAKKKTTKTTRKKNNNNFDIKRLMDSSGSYRNLIYGVVTVVVLFLIIFLGMRTLSQNQGEVNEGAVTTNETADQKQYEVVEGDTLWGISEKVYGTGFNWQQIAEENNLENPGVVEAGTTLIIPEVSPTTDPAIAQDMTDEQTVSEVTISPTAVSQESDDLQEGSETVTRYTVEAGDNLWNIAVAQYNDGYRWVDIARVNNLVNPDYIHVGNNLEIPR